MKFLLPTGIGDSVWGLHKVQSIANLHDKGCITVYLTYGDKSKIQQRALDFVRRFRFVNKVEMRPYEIMALPGVTPDGYYSYIPDGWYDFGKERVCALIPNAYLERGIRLEEWMPNHAINWNIWDDFRISWWEQRFARKLKERIGDYAVFYPGPMHGNTIAGHNRGSIWQPQDWINLGYAIQQLGLKIVVVGATYDADYYDHCVAPGLNGGTPSWVNLIGKTNIGELFAVTNGAKFVVSYQAGVGIVSTYLGTPTAIFWRAHRDSLLPDGYLSFREEMASAWVPPHILAARKHLPLIYGKCSVDSIVEEIKERHWI